MDEAVIDVACELVIVVLTLVVALRVVELLTLACFILSSIVVAFIHGLGPR